MLSAPSYVTLAIAFWFDHTDLTAVPGTSHTASYFRIFVHFVSSAWKNPSKPHPQCLLTLKLLQLSDEISSSENMFLIPQTSAGSKPCNMLSELTLVLFHQCNLRDFVINAYQPDCQFHEDELQAYFAHCCITRA